MKKNRFLLGFSTIVCTFIGLTSVVSCNHEEVIKEETVFHVTFDYGYDNKTDQVEVKLGEKVTKPSDPIREGYEFTYWSLDGEEYNFDNYVTKDITLLANYEKLPEKYTVTFDYGYDNKITEVEVTEGEKVTKPSDPIREGYEFTYWSLNGEEYDFDSVISNDITLLANYEEIPPSKCTVVFDYGYDDKTISSTVDKGSKVESPTVEERDTYIFKYWTLDGEIFDFDTLVESNITLVANWAEPITFESEDATFSFQEKIETPNDNRASGGRSVSCLYSTAGDTITFDVYSEKETSSVLGIYCNTVDAFNFEESFKLMINGEQKIIGQTTGTGWDGTGDGAYYDFRKPVVVKDVKLNAGWNTVALEVVDNMKSSTNFDRLTITSIDKISGSAQTFEAENAQINSEVTTIENSVRASNGQYVGNFNNKGDTITFEFESDTEASGKLGIDINLNDPIDLKNYFKITLNDKEITMPAVTNKYWSGNLYDEFGHLIKNNIELIKGANVLTFEIICDSTEAANGKLNFDRIALFSSSILK